MIGNECGSELSGDKILIGRRLLRLGLFDVSRIIKLEQVTGIERVIPAWKAGRGQICYLRRCSYLTGDLLIRSVIRFHLEPRQSTSSRTIAHAVAHVVGGGGATEFTVRIKENQDVQVGQILALHLPTDLVRILNEGIPR